MPGKGRVSLASSSWWMGRYPLERFPSDRIAEWLRENTDVDARILSPVPYALTVATGRPNASGFTEILHTRPYTGPGYLDAVRLLEPAALRRLGIKYVHAPDDWANTLADRARRWLQDPSLFEPLIRDGVHTLYRVQPAFLALEVQPAPGSFEALRHAVPRGSGAYLSPANGSLDTFRVVAVAVARPPAGIPGPGRPASPGPHPVGPARRPDRRIRRHSRAACSVHVFCRMHAARSSGTRRLPFTAPGRRDCASSRGASAAVPGATSRRRRVRRSLEVHGHPCR